MEYLELGNQLKHLAVTHEGPGQCPSSGAAAAATGREVLLVLFSTATDDSRDLIPASFQCFLTKHGKLIPSGHGHWYWEAPAGKGSLKWKMPAPGSAQSP